MRLAFVGLALSISSCAQPKPDVDVSAKNQVCARECSKTYSMCVAGAGQTFANRLIAGDVITARNTGLELCIETCPAK